MGLHHELSIYRDARRLLEQTLKIVRNLPRDLKQTMGKSLLDGVSDFSRLIMRANVALGAGKVVHLDDLIERVEVIGFQFRALAEMRAIPRTHHAEVIETLAAIGAQAGGWKKASAAASPVQPSLW